VPFQRKSHGLKANGKRTFGSSQAPTLGLERKSERKADLAIVGVGEDLVCDSVKSVSDVSYAMTYLLRPSLYWRPTRSLFRSANLTGARILSFHTTAATSSGC
jgi:hypothetical protein